MGWRMPSHSLWNGIQYQGVLNPNSKHCPSVGLKEERRSRREVFSRPEHRIHIPHRLRDIGVQQEHIETLADLAIADFAHPNNPKPLAARLQTVISESAVKEKTIIGITDCSKYANYEKWILNEPE